MRTTRSQLRAKQNESSRGEMQRILQTQKNLRIRRLEENRQRFKDGTAIDESDGKHVQKLTSINAFREATDFPVHMRLGYCSVDDTHNVVFIPFKNVPIPFHISTIRSVQWQQHDSADTKKYCTIRFAFHVPGASGESEILPALVGNRAVMLKEVAVKSDKAMHCQEVVKKIQDIQKRLKNKETLGPTAPIAQLIPNRSSQKVMIRHLMVRYIGAPTRKSIGTLEAHINGLRYTGAGGREVIQINYSNVKHCIFQPCKSDQSTILHFHLKSPILVNNKRQLDIQFFTEVCAMVDDLQSRRRRMRDPDELQEEAKELHLQNRTNSEYKRFVEGMEGFCKDEMMVEAPIRKLAFRGVPRNENVLLMPTSRALVHLSAWPAFIISLEEIEIVCLERVSHGLRNFDLTIVFTDHSKAALTINSCDVSSIDLIKRWLTECDIVWYESTVPLNWRSILKTIRQDPSGFYNELGGFGAFMADGDDPTGGSGAHGEGASDSDEEDENFQDRGESYSSDEESDYSSSSGKSDKESDDSNSGGGSASDPEGADSAPDWDAMEKNAAEEDLRKRQRDQAEGHSNSDSEENEKRPKKRRKVE